MLASMRVVPVPCLADNYAYVVVADDGMTAAVVDPSEAPPVLAAVQSLGVRVSALWLTHHHPDHTGGVEGLLAALGAVPVVGSQYDFEKGRIPGQTVAVDDTDTLPLGAHEARVLAIPGHTLGAVAYWIGDELFTGDTLFLAGCGRVFEGDMEMMAHSLLRLRALPRSLRVWCGHEYAEKNLAFAAEVDPTNAHIAERVAETRARRARGEPSVPWTLGDDLRVNPFLRFDQSPPGDAAEPIRGFTRLRERRNAF